MVEVENGRLARLRAVARAGRTAADAWDDGGDRDPDAWEHSYLAAFDDAWSSLEPGDMDDDDA
jgi:hypothetical protein